MACPSLSRNRLAFWASIFVATLAAQGRAEAEYFAVCDAGSTGTRLYVFQIDAAASNASSVFVKKTKPGLSSYADIPEAALSPLLKLLIEGAEKVPEALRKKTSLFIFGTAGMRLLPATKQDDVWRSVRSLAADPSYPFDPEQLQARTVSGDEEGMWAVLTANFLTGRMSLDLLSLGRAAPLGLMDLGGSSTQIAIPAAGAAEKGSHFGKGALVHSYLGFGMTHIREQVRKNTPGGEDAACYMPGVVVEDGLKGAGDAPTCRQLIRKMIAARSESCNADEAAEKPCLGALDALPAADSAIKKGAVDFYAVAGLTYVVDFVRWWLELNPDGAAFADTFLKAYPKPSLAELSVAVDVVCKGDYSFVLARTADKSLAHPFTREDNGPYRCFQANYILVLLETYGFAQDGRSITYAVDVDGEDLEWPLGALLHQRAAKAAANSEL